MFTKPHCPVIALEEHYWDEELSKTYTGSEAGRPGEQSKRLHDFTGIRIKEISCQVRSSSFTQAPMSFPSSLIVVAPLAS